MLKEMEKVLNIMKMVYLNLKENFQMGEKMDKEKNINKTRIMGKLYYILKEIIKMGKKMERV